MFDTADITKPGHYSPSQTALLLLDFHTMFVQKAGGPQAPAALDVAVKMRTWAKSLGVQVVHGVIDVNLPPFPTCKDPEMFKNVLAAMQSGGAEEPAELVGEGDDITFLRRPGYVSALKSPGLEDFLQKKGIKSLILAGLSTSGCVMRTAVAATDAEYVVSVISDACADPAEGVHDMMVGKILNRAYVATGSEIQEGLSNTWSKK
ncbi:Isochorismatase hydrolase [Hypoxylon trugodes]|uniref:Isochorismatase hydrolase n=1 Tax=Hypoxylon trugodes TaxID=326681 RepID=UPI002191BDA5|nr:Isochorismatase hydrolase [Hypoxylon trugodes]KAI1383745.1 Isochorismatase hydrolase [Hypoxylon trugodes]